MRFLTAKLIVSIGRNPAIDAEANEEAAAEAEEDAVDFLLLAATIGALVLAKKKFE